MDGGVCEHCGRGAAAGAGAGAGAAGAGARAGAAAAKARSRKATEGASGGAAKARPRKAPEGGGGAKAEGGADKAPPKPPPRRTQSEEPVRYEEEDSMAALARLWAKEKDQQVVARKEQLRNLLRL